MKKCTKAVIENFSEPCLLFLLAVKPSYGYEIRQNLEEKCGCQADIGNLYRCLNRLAKDGFLKRFEKLDGQDAPPGPKRSLYKLTANGKKLLGDWMGALESTNKTINQLIANYKHYENNKQ